MNYLMNQAKNPLAAFKDDCIVGLGCWSYASATSKRNYSKKHGRFASLGALAKKGPTPERENLIVIFYYKTMTPAEFGRSSGRFGVSAR